jgi:hypothetical protein
MWAAHYQGPPFPPTLGKASDQWVDLRQREARFSMVISMQAKPTHGHKNAKES